VLRLHDPTDNDGLGWVRLTKGQLVDFLYIGLKLARRSHRRDFIDRNAIKSDAAAKAIATELADRLGHYPVFGPARPSDGLTCGGRPKDDLA
jgi:hypothetical protein